MDTITLGSFIRNRWELIGETLRGLAVELDIAAPYLHDIQKGCRKAVRQLRQKSLRNPQLHPFKFTLLS